MLNPIETNSEMFWLNAANIVLGLVVVVCCIVVMAAVVQEVAARARLRSKVSQELDSDLRAMVGLDGHAFPVSGLGLTMADGGEPLKKDKKGK